MIVRSLSSDFVARINTNHLSVSGRARRDPFIRELKRMIFWLTGNCATRLIDAKFSAVAQTDVKQPSHTACCAQDVHIRFFRAIPAVPLCSSPSDL